MLALLAQDFDDTESDEWALTTASGKISREFIDRLVIPVPESYENAIKDPIWGKL